MNRRLPVDDRRLTQADVNNVAKTQALKMTESDFKAINPKGHKRKYRADGTYEWCNSWKSNEGGKRTKTTEAISEGMAPFIAQDNERFSALQERMPRVAMRDAQGGTHFVEPGRADAAARTNGWGHTFRVARVIKKAGPDGMLFTLFKDEWVPSGRWCAGEPHAFSRRPEHGNADGTMSTKERYEDPDGRYWRFIKDEWRRF